MEDEGGSGSQLRRAQTPLLAPAPPAAAGGDNIDRAAGEAGAMEQRPSSALTTEEDGMGPPASGGGGGGGGGDEGGDKPPKSVLLSVCSFILITEFCERLSYYGMSGSLVYLFQNRLGLTNSEADNQYAIWSGLCYCTPLLGGWLADTYLGRFKCIATFSCIYFLGLLLLLVAVWPHAADAGSSSALIFGAIYMVALGDGGIKPNVVTFGADQFDRSKPHERRELQSFFNAFYAAINVGALISFTLVVSVCQFGVSWLGGKDYRFVAGFAIPALATAAAIAVFLLGSPRYKKRPPKGSAITTAVKVVAAAAWATLTGRRRGPSALLEEGEGEGEGATASSSSSPPSWLDRAKRSQGDEFAEADVEGVKLVWRLLPFLFFLMPYWACYTQMSTTYQNQGCQMDLRLGSSRIAVSTLNLFDTLAIILLIPVFDRVVYPALKRRGFPLTQLQKFGAGFGFAVLAMLVAGAVESYRKAHAPPPAFYPADPTDAAGVAYLRAHVSACKNLDDFDPFKYQAWYATAQQQQGQGQQDASGASDPAPTNCRQVGPPLPDGTLPLASIACDAVPLVSPVSVFWQVPQFLLVGVSEILTSVTSYEFFYSQAPAHMRSFTQSLNLLTTALGTWLCIPLVYMANADPTHQLIPGDLNEGFLASFFFLLAGIMVLNTLGFAWAAKGYTYVDIEDGDEEGEGGGDGEGAEIRVVGQDEETVLLHDPVGAAGGGKKGSG